MDGYGVDPRPATRASVRAGRSSATGSLGKSRIALASSARSGTIPCGIHAEAPWRDRRQGGPGFKGAPSTQEFEPKRPAVVASLIEIAWAILELDRKPGDILVTKRSWRAFANTDLESQLKDRGVTQVLIAGVATGTGVEATARQAYEQGFNVTLAIDAMTDTRSEAHDYSIRNVFPRLGETGTTQEIIALVATRSA